MAPLVTVSLREIFGKTLVVFVLLSGLSFLVGCFNSPDGGSTIATGDAGPLSVSKSLSLSINENGPMTTVILPYTSSVGVVPRSCEIQALSNITEASPCACVSGTCRVGIQGKTNVYGQGSFSFRLAGASGVFSNFGKAEVKIRQVVVLPFSGYKQNQRVTVGEAIKSPLVILVRNSENTPVRGVKVSWKALEESGRIFSCIETSDSKGLAQCNWTLGTKSGSQGVEASIFGGQSKASFSVSAMGGKVTKLSYLEQPRDTAAGVPWVRPPQVVFQDVYGNQSSSSADVTLTIAANPSSGALSGKTTVKAVDGIASFSGLFIDKVGVNYTLKASSPGLAGVVSSAFRVKSGAAAKLVFTQQPGGAVDGEVFTTQPIVMIQDAYGNQVTNGVDAGAILTISLDSGTGALFGDLPVGAALGVSSWNGLFIEPLGPKRLKVTKSDLTASGGSGSLSGTSDIFENKPNLPPVIADLKARAASGAVSLSWAVSSNGIGNNILRGTSPNSLVQIATSKTNAYTDSTVSNGILYYYAVQAFSKRGTGASSQSIQAKPLSTPSIRSLAINDTTGSLVVSWSESVGASGYTVKYSTESGYAVQGAEGCIVKASEKTCTVSRLTPETKYCFVVNAINDDSGSVNSQERCGGALVLSSLEPGNRQIKLKYKSEGAASVKVQYGTEPGSYTSSLPGGRDEVIVSGLVNGVTYYFQLEAKYPSEGLFSGGVILSAEKTASPDGPQEFDITSVLSGDGTARITWGASSGAEHYTIKYGTSSGSYPTAFQAEFKGTSIKITGLTEGTTYYFMVTAVNKSGSQDANKEFVKALKSPVILAKESYITPTMALDWSMKVPVKLVGEEFFSLPCSSISFKPNTGGLLDSSSIQGKGPDCRLGLRFKGGVTGLLVLTLSVEMDSEIFTKDVEVTIIPGASLAYSTRLVVLGYEGKAMEVRHKNGALADVAFDQDGKVSPSSLLRITRPPHKYEVSVNSEYRYEKGDVVSFEDFYNFKKAGMPPEPAAVFVRRWYDQSGNDNHALAPAEDQPYAVTPSDKQPYIVKEVLVNGSLSAVFQDRVSFEKRGRNYGDRVGTESYMEIKYKESSLDFAGGYSISAVFSEGGNWKDPKAPLSALFTQKYSGGSVPIALGILGIYENSGPCFGLGIYESGRGWNLIGMWTSGTGTLSSLNPLRFAQAEAVWATGTGNSMVPKDDRHRMRFFGSYDSGNSRMFFHLQGGDVMDVYLSPKRPIPKSTEDFYVGRRWDDLGAPDNYFPMNLNELVVYKYPLEKDRWTRVLADQGSYYPVP